MLISKNIYVYESEEATRFATRNYMCRDTCALRVVDNKGIDQDKEKS